MSMVPKKIILVQRYWIYFIPIIFDEALENSNQSADLGGGKIQDVNVKNANVENTLQSYDHLTDIDTDKNSDDTGGKTINETSSIYLTTKWATPLQW